MTSVAISLPTLDLAEDERDLVGFHLARLGRFELRNALLEAYYEGRQRVQNLGISLPPSLTKVEVAAGWPGTIVDVLEERLDFQGWTVDGEDAFDLAAVYRDNSLDVDAGLGHHDALTYGTGFALVGTGFDDEPDQLITVESPRRVTGLWDARLRRLTSALSIDEVRPETKEPIALTLLTPRSTIRLARRPSGAWRVEDRDDHELGRVLAAMLPNRPRASQPCGRSEITPAVRAYTDQAVRTLLGMEINREFYSAPQRYVMGAEEHMFMKADGTVATGWESVMGRMLALPRDEDGELPTVGQFNPASPTPYLEQVRGLSQMVAAEGALPASYLGFVTDNPTSADAIRQAEARLVKRAERRQLTFGRAWLEVARLVLLVREGKVPADFGKVSVKWRDAATPTRSAAADEVVKLVGAGILPPDSAAVLDRIGLTPQEKDSVTKAQRRNRSLQTVTALAAATPPPAAPTQEVPTNGTNG